MVQGRFQGHRGNPSYGSFDGFYSTVAACFMIIFYNHCVNFNANEVILICTGQNVKYHTQKGR